MSFANDAGLVAHHANAFPLDKRQIVIHLHGSSDIVIFVDEDEGGILFDIDIVAYRVCFLFLRMALWEKGAKEQGDGKDLSFHWCLIFMQK